MQLCCICQCSINTEINIFTEQIGDPPIQIIDLINECTLEFFESEHEFKEDSSICMKCAGKLLIYYKASLIMKKIKNDIHDLIKNGSDPNCNSVIETKIDRSSIDSMEHDISESFTENQVENEDFIKIEYIDATDDIIDEVEDEIVLDNVNALFKAEPLDEPFETSDNSAYGDMLEIEKIYVEHENEDSQNEQQTKRSTSTRKSVVCSECNLEFTNLRKYNAHRRKEHFSGFVCDQCGKTFYSQSGFVTHSHTHKPVKEFVCTVCGQEYHHKVYLKRHMAWHTGEMPYQCEICSKRFVHKVGLHRHRKIHEDNRNITCDICGFKFRTNAHLNRHKLTHTGAKPHSCPICGKCFSQVYNMKVHIKEHEQPGSTRRNRMKCKRCSKSFSNKINFHQHCAANECQYVASDTVES